MIEKSHSSGDVCGVGPAERTGKSRVTYWPGGTRARSTVRRATAPEPSGETTDFGLLAELKLLLMVLLPLIWRSVATTSGGGSN